MERGRSHRRVVVSSVPAGWGCARVGGVLLAVACAFVQVRGGTDCDPSDHVCLGKRALADKDLAAAHAGFAKALEANADNPEANFYYAFTLLASTCMSTEAAALLDRLAIEREGRNLLDWEAGFIRDDEGVIQFPDNTPTEAQIHAFVDTVVMPAVEHAKTHLDRVGRGFNSVVALTDDPLLPDYTVEFDYGDVLMFKALLRLGTALVQIAQAYNLDLSIKDVYRNYGAADFDPVRDILEKYPQLFTVTSPALLDEARAALVDAIELYAQASDAIRAETDAQDDDFISFDNATQERDVRFWLEEVRKSLNGERSGAFALELSQVLDLRRFFTEPVSLRDLAYGLGLQSLLARHLLPQLTAGLARLQTVGRDFRQVWKPDTHPVSRQSEIDYGDIAVAKAIGNAVAGAAELLQAYDLNVNWIRLVWQIDTAADAARSIQHGILDPSPELGRLRTDVSGAAHLDAAREYFVNAVQHYVEASDFVRAEKDDQADDVFTIGLDREGVPRDKALRTTLETLRNSLQSPQSIAMANDVTTTVDLGMALGPRGYFDLRNAFAPLDDKLGDFLPFVLPDPTLGGIFPAATNEQVIRFFGSEDDAGWWDHTTISGTVRNGEGVPIAGIPVGYYERWTWEWDGGSDVDTWFEGATVTNAQGAYTLSVPTSTFEPWWDVKVVLFAGGASRYDVTFYDGKSTLEDANAITTVEGSMPGYDFVLRPLGESGPTTLEFSAARYTVTEEVGVATVRVVRRGGTSAEVSVAWSVSGGTAQAAADFGAVPGTLTFKPGETAKSLTITIVDDGAGEDDETVQFTLANPSGGATLGDTQTATLTIVDDDGKPSQLEFSAGTYAAGEEATGIPVTVTRAPAWEETVTVRVRTTDATATAGSDYSVVAGALQLTFGPGETSKTFNVQLLDDAVREGNEHFTIELTDVTGNAVLGARTTATCVIIDNEVPAAAYDVDGNEAVDAEDLAAILEIAVGILAVGDHKADLNGDGEVNAADAIVWLKTESVGTK